MYFLVPSSLLSSRTEVGKKVEKGLWQVVEEGVDTEQSVIILLWCLSVNCVSDFKLVVSVAVTTCITIQQKSCAVHLGTNSHSHL